MTEYGLTRFYITNGASLAFAIILARKIKFRGSVFGNHSPTRENRGYVGAGCILPNDKYPSNQSGCDTSRPYNCLHRMDS